MVDNPYTGLPDHLMEFQYSLQVLEDEADNLQWEEISSKEVEDDLSVLTPASPQNYYIAGDKVDLHFHLFLASHVLSTRCSCGMNAEIFKSNL